ncbi:hypothetical protein ACHAWF_009032 [Thalassiosira exigua]
MQSQSTLGPLGHRRRAAMSFSASVSNGVASTSAGSSARSQSRPRSPNLTLYGDLNMRPIRNAWMLEELGLPYKHQICKPWSRVAKTVHPLGKVPALLVEYEGAGNGDEDERFTVIESAAINTFLGDLAREISAADAKHEVPMLVPPSATRDRAKYDSLVLFTMTELDSQSLWIHRKHHDLPNVFGEAPTAVLEARRQFDKALDAMVNGMTTEDYDGSKEDDEKYLLPAGFSAADILFAHCCFWAQKIGWLERNVTTHATSPEMTTDGELATPKPLVPKLAAYLKRCRSRPAFVRANELRKKQPSEKKASPLHTSKL